MAIITIVGAGMMGSALAFPARENGNTVRLVGTHLDRDIICACQKTGKHPKFDTPFPSGVSYYPEDIKSFWVWLAPVIASALSAAISATWNYILEKIKVENTIDEASDFGGTD